MNPAASARTGQCCRISESARSVVESPRADRQGIAVFSYVVELADMVQTEQRLRLNQPEGYQRDEAHPASQQFRIFAMLKQGDGFLELLRRMQRILFRDHAN